MKIKKLTKQYSGGGHFKHIAEFIIKESAEFVAVRRWCWEQWGPSCERDFWYRLPPEDKNPKWCWMSDDHGRIRINMLSDAETSWLSLKWA